MTTTTAIRPATRRRNRHLPLQVLLGFLLVYFLIPFWWVIVNGSKNAAGLFGGGSALWFAEEIDYWGNLVQLFSFYQRYRYGSSAVVPLGLGLSVVSVLIMLFTGWKGGELVFRHRVAVYDEPPP